MRDSVFLQIEFFLLVAFSIVVPAAIFWVMLAKRTISLYLLPALFAGIGINLVSHVLIYHLASAEHRFDQNHPPR